MIKISNYEIGDWEFSYNSFIDLSNSYLYMEYMKPVYLNDKLENIIGFSLSYSNDYENYFWDLIIPTFSLNLKIIWDELHFPKSFTNINEAMDCVDLFLEKLSKFYIFI